MTREQVGSASQSVAEGVKLFRNNRGWSQEALAARVTELGYPMHQTAVAKIENGDRKVTVDDLMVLAAALDVSPAQLLVPVETGGDYSITPATAAYVWQVWEWVRGEAPPPVPGKNMRAWHKSVQVLWLYDAVRRGQDDANKALTALRAAEHAEASEAAAEAKGRYLAALERYADALGAMQQVGLDTDGLVFTDPDPALVELLRAHGVPVPGKTKTTKTRKG